MTQYTHNNLPGFTSPAPFKLGEGEGTISYARGWWERASEQEIAALGFVEYVAPEPEPVEPTIPDRVTSRQFKLQLLAAGLLDDVEAWIATQDRAVQIAFEYSGTFLRSEPMMELGFAGLGYSPEQVDAFYLAASEI